ncbi:MAG: DnaJ domain-containing protein, partial [Candidatus Moraniibacteriota bacterium]
MSFTRYFEILGVNPNSSFEQIRLAYKDLIKVWHPDRFSNDPRLQLKAQEKLKEGIIAYKALVSYFEEQKQLAEKKQRIEEESLHIIAQQKKMEEKRRSEEERNKKIQGHLATCLKYLKEKN